MGEIKISDIPEKLWYDDIKTDTMHYTVGMLGTFKDDDSEVPGFIGSGSLIHS